MSIKEMREWLSAVEFLMNGDVDCYVENDFGDKVKVKSITGGRYRKIDRSGEFCGITEFAAEAALWLYENNKSDDEF